MRSAQGFSLLEMLIAIGVIAALGAIGSGFFGALTSGVELEETARVIVSDLKFAREKAIAGVERLNWGVHFVNGAEQYYEFFSTSAPNYTTDASTTVVATTFLAADITFTAPPVSSSTDIIFNKITGSSSSSTITIIREASTHSISVTPSGTIY